MRIDSGLQGYYYDQGRFKRPEIDGDESGQQNPPAAAPQRVQQPFALLVESSTLLSSSLSSALWAMETRAARPPTPAPASTSAPTDDETAGKVNAYYLQYTDDEDAIVA